LRVPTSTRTELMPLSSLRHPTLPL
jgi:hypothetical protein